MKRGCLGNIEIRQDYWTNGKGSNELKQNETYLYAEIDCCQEYIGIAKSYEEAQTQYNKQDLFYLCLVAISMSDDDEKLYKYGVVIGNMVSEGKIYKRYSDINQENETLNQLVDEMAVRVANFNETALNEDFMYWYSDKIMSLNSELSYMGVGSTTRTDELSAKAKESGLYWIYLLNSAEDVYDGGDVQTLREKVRFHEDYLNWVNSCDVNVTSDSILANARAGIIRETGQTPEQVLASMKKNDGMGAGVEAATAIVALITKILICAAAAVSLVVGIIKLVKEVKGLRAEEEAKRYSQDDDEIKGKAPSPGDYGYDTYLELMADYENAKDKLDFYEGISDPTLIGGTIGFWTLVFGAAIISNRKKK